MADSQLNHSPWICQVGRGKWNMTFLCSTKLHSEGEYLKRVILQIFRWLNQANINPYDEWICRRAIWWGDKLDCYSHERWLKKRGDRIDPCIVWQTIIHVIQVFLSWRKTTEIEFQSIPEGWWRYLKWSRILMSETNRRPTG